MSYYYGGSQNMEKERRYSHRRILPNIKLLCSERVPNFTSLIKQNVHFLNMAALILRTSPDKTIYKPGLVAERNTIKCPIYMYTAFRRCSICGSICEKGLITTILILLYTSESSCRRGFFSSEEYLTLSSCFSSPLI